MEILLIVETITDYVGGRKKALAMHRTKKSLYYRIKYGVWAEARDAKRRRVQKKDNNSLADTMWNSKYHIV